VSSFRTGQPCIVSPGKVAPVLTERGEAFITGPCCRVVIVGFRFDAMNAATPPSPPPLPANAPLSDGSRLLIRICLVAGMLVGALIILRVCGLLRPFSVPTGGMTPAVSAGDHVMMEGITFLTRNPRRGDVVVFKTDGIALLPSSKFVLRRIAGEPRDQLRIAEGKLYVNDRLVKLSNAEGEIVYSPPPRLGNLPLKTEVTVPEGCYFVLGDNSTNSFDSRFWGSLPREKIMGRICFCYWPPARFGVVR
jgi:signal peptidase I